MFRLRCPQDRLAHWAARFRDQDDDGVAERLAPGIRARGYMTRREFLALCEWKTPRSRPHVSRNSAARIRDATTLALATQDERAKIGILRLLDGVGLPTASVLLHFCDARPYPILDYRMMWSLGHAKPPAYTVDFWLAYTRFMRELAATSGLSLRELDRALWQYSKENQRGAWLHAAQAGTPAGRKRRYERRRWRPERLQCPPPRRTSMLLLDDRKARRIAEVAYGLRVKGTPGILVTGKRRGLLPSVRPLLEEMRARGYYLAQPVVERTLREAGKV